MSKTLRKCKAKFKRENRSFEMRLPEVARSGQSSTAPFQVLSVAS